MERQCERCRRDGGDPRGPSACYDCRTLNDGTFADSMAAAWGPPAFVTGYSGGEMPTKVEAITPGEARRSDDFTKRELETHIRELNRMLKGGGRTYACSLIHSAKLRQAIIAEFSGKGWRVQVVSDWRDGDFIQFSEPA